MSSAPPPTVENAPGAARLRAAVALDAVRRTVDFGLRAEQGQTGPRFLGGTCRHWLARVPDEALEEAERAAIHGLREAVATLDAGEPLAPREILETLRTGLTGLGGLLACLDVPPAAEPRARLLPEGELERAVALRTPPPPPEPPAAEPRRPAPPPAPASRPAAPSAPAPRPATSRVAAAPVAVARASDPALPAPAPPPVEPPGEEGDDPAERGGEASRDSSVADLVVQAEACIAELWRALDPPEPAPEPEHEPVVPVALRDPAGAGAPIEEIVPSVPARLLESLRSLGIEAAADLLLLLPVEYELLPRAVEPSEVIPPGQRHVLRGTVIRRLTRLSPFGRRHEVVLGDETARVVCRWMTPRVLSFWQAMEPGARIAIHGLVEEEGELRLLHEGEQVWLDSRGQGRQACYALPGVADADLRTLLGQVLDACAGQIADPLPEEMRKRLRLLPFEEALRRLHFPVHGPQRGRERLAFDELLLYQLGSAIERKRQPRERGTAHPIRHRLVAQIMASRTHPLSDGQEIAFSEIRRDLARPLPMNRLLQGEVGLGKGFVALLSAVVVAEDREQVVFVAPDALAAEHRFLFAEPLLRSVGLVPALLLDKPDAAMADALKRGAVHVAFASPWIIKAWPAFKRLGMVVVEERQEYGSVTLASLPSQGARPDLLVLTDAPIPTSIALTLFSDMDLSLVPGQLGPGLQVSSHSWADHMEAYTRAQAELEAGRQVYVVLPMVEGQERLNLRELARFADALRGEAFPGKRIGVFSGLMSREERQRTYDDFIHRRIDVLLTTTIIEDGPAVLNATACVVLEADRFDLVRLHRLRSHVARGLRSGRCMLVLSETPDPLGVRRVEIMVREPDAFRIAEHDLVTRGAEALLGDRARELPRFKYVDPLEHRDLLVRARSEAFQIMDQPNLLTQPAFDGLREALEESWERWFPGRTAPAKKRPSSRGTRSSRRRRRGRSR